MSKFGFFILSIIILGSTSEPAIAASSNCVVPSPYVRTLDSIVYQNVEDLDLLIAKITLNDGSAFLHVTNNHSPSHTLAKWQKGISFY